MFTWSHPPDGFVGVLENLAGQVVLDQLEREIGVGVERVVPRPLDDQQIGVGGAFRKLQRAFQRRHAAQTPAALERLQQVARAGGNVFAELMETVQVASLGQISDALFEVGGRYRRAM